MDDWQEAAFSSRHMHNRVGRSEGNHSKSKRSQPFDVRKTYGSYTCKCAAWQKMGSSLDGFDTEQDATLELYRLTPNNEGIVGEVNFPGVLKAAVILAASRESLNRTVLEATSSAMEIDAASEHANANSGAEIDKEVCDPETNRFQTFEKNSFRYPKFWLQWNGVMMANATREEPESRESGLGYVVFAQNDCRKFKATFNCGLLGWKDVAISGRKTAGRNESDVLVTWGPDHLVL